MDEVLKLTLCLLLIGHFVNQLVSAQIGAARKRRARLRRMILDAENRRRATKFDERYLSYLFAITHRNARSVWTHCRVNEWWTSVVPGFTQEQWVEHFRMSEEAFQYICSRLGATLEKSDTNFRRCVPVKKRVAIAISRLASSTNLRLVAHLFGVGISTVCRCVHEFCTAVNEILLPELMSFPSFEKLHEMAADFEENLGLPQCVGAIKKSHIQIVAPTEYHTEYINHKGYHSVILQGVVDGKGLFWHASAGCPGSMPDPRVLQISGFWDIIEQGLLFPDHTKNFAGHDVGFYLLGHGEYPLQTWLLKPFSDIDMLTAEQMAYNDKIYRARSVVEKAFSRLKGRWRCLLKRNDSHVDHVKAMVFTCCVLHNLCETRGEQYRDEWDPDPTVEPEELFVAEENIEDEAATSVRDALVHYVNTTL